MRALTENASTPATPTTAISSATPANPDSTKAFSRSGASTCARTSASVAARSTGWSAEISRMIRVTGVDQRVRVARRVHEQAAAVGHLPQRVIDRERRARHDVLVVHVRHHADDAPRLGLAEVRIGPPHVAVERVAVREQPLRDALAHDHDELAAGPVVVGEVAAGR